MIKNLLLDLGGVMVTLDKNRAVARFQQMGIHDADKLLDPYKQAGLFLRLESGDFTRETFTEALNKEYGTALTPADVEWGLAGYFVRVDDEKFDFILHDLPRDIRVFCLSNTNPFARHTMEDPHFLKNGIPMRMHFEEMFLSYELGMCKPDPRIFEIITRRAGIRPEETLFLDDGAANTAEARRQGFVTYKPLNGEDWTAVVSKMIGSEA